jgi:hypothetical protein
MKLKDQIANVYDVPASDETTHPTGGLEQRLGIADVSLRQRALNPAPIDAIESSAPVSMGKSPS